MRTDPLEMAIDLRAREIPFALATVVRREPPVSARPGDKAIITADGVLSGWVGGSCAHSTVLHAALRALADGRPRLLVLDPAPEAERRPGVEVFRIACHSGGALEIYVEPYLPQPRLVIMGASPVAEALVALGKIVGYRVYVLDPGLDPGAAAGRFSGADGVFRDFRAREAWGPGETFVLVTTMGHADEDALEAALVPALAPLPGQGRVPARAPLAAEAREPAHAPAPAEGPMPAEARAPAQNVRPEQAPVPAPAQVPAAAPAQVPDYVAVVASRRRFREICSELARRGVPAGALARIRSPAGLDIHARLPEEIAVSVLAEIIQVRRSRAGSPPEARNAGAPGTGSPVGALDGGAPDIEAPGTRVPIGAPGAGAPDAAVATDPVCGMAVSRAAAPAVLEHRGTVYYFCCPGCRVRFQEGLERDVVPA